jgi:hypothetical protein
LVIGLFKMVPGPPDSRRVCDLKADAITGMSECVAFVAECFFPIDAVQCGSEAMTEEQQFSEFLHPMRRHLEYAPRFIEGFWLQGHVFAGIGEMRRVMPQGNRRPLANPIFDFFTGAPDLRSGNERSS